MRRGVLLLLSAEKSLQVCGEAGDGREVVQKAQELRPDAIVMDISMPNVDGLEASREIRRNWPDAKIVILSQHNSTEMKKQAFAAGANEYVETSAVSSELVAALEGSERKNDRDIG